MRINPFFRRLSIIAIAGVLRAYAPAALPLPGHAPGTNPAVADDATPENQPSTPAQDQSPREAVGAATVPSKHPTTMDNAIQTVDLTSTTWVDAHLKNATLPDAVQAVLRPADTSANIDPYERPAELDRHDFDVTHLPLVQALVEVAQTYDADVKREAHDGHWSLVRRIAVPTTEPATRPPPAEHWAKAPVCITGPFGAFVRSITVNHSIDPLPEGETESDTDRQAVPVDTLTIRLSFCAEPRAVVFERAPSMVLQACTDDRGESLLRQPAAANLPAEENAAAAANPAPPVAGRKIAGGAIMTIDEVFKLPPAGVKQLAHVEGYLPVGVISRHAHLQFDSPPQGSSRTVKIADLHATIGAFADLDGGAEQATIIVHREGLDLDAWHARVNMIQTVGVPRIRDAQGRELLPEGLQIERVQDDRVTLRLRCNRSNRGGEVVTGFPARWDWNIPLEMKSVRIPFSFEQLPLPAE